MLNPTSNFDWTESPPYLDLLRLFVKPHKAQITDFQQLYLNQNIKENPQKVIERFISEGVLVPASVEEGLEHLFMADELKKLLLKKVLEKPGCKLGLSGTKRVLAERLVSIAHDEMSKIVLEHKIVKCSVMALEILSKDDKKKQNALDDAKQQSFEALKNGKEKVAYKIYTTFKRTFIDPNFKSDPYKVEDLQCILASNPQILSGIAADNLANLKAALCMKSLWDEWGDDEFTETWLPTTFASGLKSNRVALNYLSTHTGIKRMIEEASDYKRVKIEFHSGDTDSCELCQSLDGKEFEIDKVPDLPIIDCKSDIGCQCSITGIYDYDDEDEEEIDPVDKLSKLKQMLEIDLITRDEYEKKKAEVLARF